MKIPIEEERLIERVLVVLRLAEENGLEPGAMEELPPEKLREQGINQHTLAQARGFLLFLDEIPGGFLIYRA